MIHVTHLQYDFENATVISGIPFLFFYQADGNQVN